jgi:hypothetical protein
MQVLMITLKIAFKTGSSTGVTSPINNYFKIIVHNFVSIIVAGIIACICIDI